MTKINFIRIASLLVLLFTAFIANAQDGTKPAQSFMYNSGRIYVVIAVMLTILAGLILYMVRLDRKLTKLEKEG